MASPAGCIAVFAVEASKERGNSALTTATEDRKGEKRAFLP